MEFCEGKKRYTVELHELEPWKGQRDHEKWRADCGESHAVGKTPGDAADRIVAFMRAREAEK